MKRINQLVFLLVFHICFYIAFPPLVSAQSDLAADQTAGFISQGTNTTCLKQEAIYTEGFNKHSSSATAKFHLSGKCISTDTCTILFKWSENWIAAKGYPGCNEKNLNKKGEVDCDGQKEEWEARNPVLIAGQKTLQGVVPAGDVSFDTIEALNVHMDVKYNFYAVGKGEVTQLDTPPGTTADETADNEVGSNNTLQNADLAFTLPSLAPTPATIFDDSDSNCVAMAWDPYGRVFDAVSLEPMSGVRITMMEKDAAGNLVPALLNFTSNESTTDNRGLYNILVDKEGTYYLNAKAPATHSFIASVSMSANFSKIYESIYKVGESFVEKINEITQHDIPLMPIGTPYTSAVVELIPGRLSSERIVGKIVYRGYVTFPFTRVCIPTKGEPICKFADKRGQFNIEVPEKLISLNFITPTLYKVNLRTGEFLQNSATQTSNPSEGFDPILKLVQGIATDANGRAIPNATVSVIVKSTKKPVYSMKADTDGAFQIAANKLPIFEYYLEFTNPTTKATVQQSTALFVKKNATTLKKNEIDPVLGTVSGKKAYIPPLSSSQNTTSQDASTAQKSKLNSDAMMSVIITVFALVSLIGVGIGVAFYAKNKSNTQQF